MLTDKQKADYIQSGGVCCPYCGSDQIEGDSYDHQEGCVTQEICCLSCDKSWTDVHSLTHIEETSPDS